MNYSYIITQNVKGILMEFVPSPLPVFNALLEIKGDEFLEQRRIVRSM